MTERLNIFRLAELAAPQAGTKAPTMDELVTMANELQTLRVAVKEVAATLRVAQQSSLEQYHVLEATIAPLKLGFRPNALQPSADLPKALDRMASLCEALYD